MTMNDRIMEGIKLREIGDYQASIHYFQKLIEDKPTAGILYYQCAWGHDAMGKERPVLYYQKAIQLGLNESDLQGAFVGLGSTYRTLGEYERAKHVLKEGMKKFPGNKALSIFYSMTLYNLDEHNEAMEILLTLLAQTSEDETIQSYQKAILFYAKQLDITWDQ
jgi:tetratricopeptide (TPR) repeat protein